MSISTNLFNSPPVGPQGRKRDFTPLDEVARTLIDNPGKWALLTTQSHRSVDSLKIRYGAGFRFTTKRMKTGEPVEIWASYHPTTNANS